MRKNIIFIFFLFIIPFAYSQNFKSGILAGISPSQVAGDGFAGFNKWGITGGMFVKYDFTEKYAAQFEMNFIQKGAKKTARPDEGDNVYYDLRLNYIEVPILLKYKWKKFVFETGISAGILINYKEDDGVSPLNSLPPFLKYDIGALIGIDYYFSDKFSINWRASNSFLPIRNYSKNPTFIYQYAQLNTVVCFTLRYQFIK